VVSFLFPPHTVGEHGDEIFCDLEAIHSARVFFDNIGSAAMTKLSPNRSQWQKKDNLVV
jgi:hypothetical protein